MANREVLNIYNEHLEKGIIKGLELSMHNI